jgi:hypothetical protein
VYALFADRLQLIVAAATGFWPGVATLLVKAAALGLAAPCVSIWRGAHRLARRIAIPLSHEHHDALLLAWRLRTGDLSSTNRAGVGAREHGR